ncbi:hypothetical protein EMCRGX_G008260 [Ephydatia muelleri]
MSVHSVQVLSSRCQCSGPPLKMPVSRSSPQDASVQVLPSRCQCPGPPLKMPVSRSSPQDASVQVLPSRCQCPGPPLKMPVSRSVSRSSPQDASVQVLPSRCQCPGPPSRCQCPGPPLKMPVSRSSPQDASVQVLPSRCQCPGPPLKMPVSRSSPQDASVQVLPSRCQCSGPPLKMPVFRSSPQDASVQSTARRCNPVMPPSKHNDPFVLKYCLTVAAASVAETVTYPLDLLKTRLQVQGHQPYKGLLQTSIGIVRDEGIVGLWKGLSPGLLRHVVYSGCRMSFYEVIRDHVFGKNPDGVFPLWKAIPTGMLAGALAQFLASPADLVKVRLQMEGRRVLEGLEPKYRGTRDAFRSILREDGVAGLWKGWAPNCQRAALVCLGDLTTYDAAKQAILHHTGRKDDAGTHALSSVFSGLVSAVLGTPADVVKTRMMNQDGRGVHYSSSWDCLTKTVRPRLISPPQTSPYPQCDVTDVKMEGFWALYKGFIPIWSRMAPWSLTFWLVYEEIRVLAGIGNF